MISWICYLFLLRRFLLKIVIFRSQRLTTKVRQRAFAPPWYSLSFATKHTAQHTSLLFFSFFLSVPQTTNHKPTIIMANTPRVRQGQDQFRDIFLWVLIITQGLLYKNLVVYLIATKSLLQHLFQAAILCMTDRMLCP